MKVPKIVKQSRMENKGYVFYGIIIVFVVIFLSSSIIFKVYQIDILPSQLFGALIGVFITAIVTAFLLRGQTEGDEKREKSVKVFEKKQEIYHNFLEKFQKIIQNGDIRIGIKKEDGSVDNTTDELKDLIFQLAFIQMHTKTENTTKILSCIAHVKQTLKEFNAKTDEEKNKGLETYYSELSQELFDIVAILKADLYHETEIDTIPQEEMINILKKFDLYAEVKSPDKYEMLTYFLSELYKQVKEKGYSVNEEKNNFKHQARQFYNEKKDCYLGIELGEEYGGIGFSLVVTQENGFFYGLNNGKWWTEEQKQQVKNVFGDNKNNKEWLFRHYWDNLNFNDYNSSEFNDLKSHRNKKSFVSEIVGVILGNIEKYQIIISNK